MFTLPDNPDVPHAALVLVSAEVHELRPTGELSGRPVYEIAEFPLRVDGLNRADCIKRLNETLEELKRKCNSALAS